MATKWGGGGAVKFYSYKKRGRGSRNCGHAEGERAQHFEVVSFHGRTLEVLAVLKWGVKSVQSFKKKESVCVWGGGGGGWHNGFRPPVFLCYRPAPPSFPVINVINDRSPTSVT